MGDSSDRDLDVRLDEHPRVAAALAVLTDDDLEALIAAGPGGVVGAGGTGGVVGVDGVPVFVKRIALTDRERALDEGSTLDVFGLPASLHFGVGSPGFGAWRELAATRAASSWVSTRQHEGFLLLHHWRVLPGAPPLAAEFRDVGRTVAFWGGHPAVRERLRALATASASVVMFLEHVPDTLAAWLEREGDRVGVAAASRIEAQLLDVATASSARGMIHFDAHFDNVLTDGRRLHLADLGLATTTDFALSDEETALVGRAGSHDLAYAVTRLVDWAVSTFGDPSLARDPVARHADVRARADGTATTPLPEPAAGIVRRYARVATIVHAFYAELFTVRRHADFPGTAVDDEVARLVADGTITPRGRSPREVDRGPEDDTHGGLSGAWRPGRDRRSP